MGKTSNKKTELVDAPPDIHKTVIASSISICLGKIFTHPLDTVKAKLQVDNSTSSYTNTVVNEPPHNNTNSKSTSSSSTKTSSGGFSNAVNNAKNPTSGSTSSSSKPSSSHTGVKPSFTSGGSTSSTSKVVSILRNNPPKVLYQGFSVAVLGSLPAGALYMTSYEYLKPTFRNDVFGKESTFLADFSAGLGAEAISCVFWCPVDVIKERLQVRQEMSKKGLNYTYSTPMQALKQIVKTDGILGLYRAYGATLVAFGPQTAINLATFEKIEGIAKNWYNNNNNTTTANPSKKSKTLQNDATNSSSSSSNSKPRILTPIPAALNFACASISGCFACLVTTPLDLVKLRMQLVRSQRLQQVTDPSSTNTKLIFNYKNIFDGLYQIAKHEGFTALFKGGVMRCIVWVPQTAIFLGSFKSILSRLD